MVKSEKFWVYILHNVMDTVNYVGVTNNLNRRMFEHGGRYKPDSFTSKYFVNKLVYFEEYVSINLAIEREKQLKKWSRSKKDELVKKLNPKF